MTRDETQRRYWAFYEAISIRMQRTAAVLLHPSRPAVKSNGYAIFVYNNRNPPLTIGVLQHVIHLLRIRNNINILNLLSLFFKGFTSPFGIRSGAFPINKNFIIHFTIHLIIHFIIHGGVLLLRLELTGNGGKFIRYPHYCQSQKVVITH